MLSTLHERCTALGQIIILLIIKPDLHLDVNRTTLHYHHLWIVVLDLFMSTVVLYW